MTSQTQGLRQGMFNIHAQERIVFGKPAASTAGAGSGASHGIGYALGATFGIAHGHTSSIMLPAVLKWNEPVNGGRQQTLSAATGQPGRPASALVADLVAGLDQPGNLRFRHPPGPAPRDRRACDALRARPPQSACDQRAGRCDGNSGVGFLTRNARPQQS